MRPTCRDFTCAGCHRTFHTATSQEEMDAEFVEKYGHAQADTDEEIVSVCDDCFAQLQAVRNNSHA